jgi:hypothetical protein
MLSSKDMHVTDGNLLEEKDGNETAEEMRIQRERERDMCQIE